VNLIEEKVTRMYRIIYKRSQGNEIKYALLQTLDVFGTYK